MNTTTLNPATTAEMLAAGPATWTIDASHTHVGFAVKHLMISTVRGRFSDVRGSVELDPAKDPVVDVQIGTASIHTGDEKRDAHLRSADFFAVDEFPAISFRGGRVQGDIGGEFTLEGTLTIRGITRPVTLQVESEGRVTDPWGNDRIGYTATARVNRKDFGLTWNVALEAGGVMVGDDIRITIETQLVRQ